MFLQPALILSWLLFLLPVSLCAEDLYKLLELDRSASDRDIKKAYRKLSKQYHPDKNPYVFPVFTCGSRSAFHLRGLLCQSCS